MENGLYLRSIVVRGAGGGWVIRKTKGAGKTMVHIAVGAVLTFGCLAAALYLLEAARGAKLFGWNWGPKPNDEVVVLRALIINSMILAVLFIRNLFSDFDVVTDRLRMKLYGVYAYLLSLSVVALILKYFDDPTLKKLDAFVWWVGWSGWVLGVYAVYLLVQIYHNIQDRLAHEKELADKFYQQLTTDQLTGIPGRVLFQEQLAEAVSEAERTGGRVAVLFLDLDDFKMFNDSLGHTFGDHLLVAVTNRFLQIVTPGMRVYRMGGDEFVFLLRGQLEDEEILRSAEKVFGALKQELEVDGQQLHIDISLGISRFPEDGRDAETLYRNAELAMYHAKSSGRNNFQLYDASMNERVSGRLALAGDLRKAVERGEFFLCYQPLVCLNTGAITGMEALVRWKHPERGLVSPGEFIPLAEETKMIIPIGEWVLYTACRQNKEWQEKGYPHVRVSVNLSACQFSQPNLAAMIKRVLQETGLEPKYLNLEITESITMNNVERAIATMHEINELGIGISIDDFGTGYSSLNYLKKFPIQTLKIDQSFVRDITDEHHDAAIPTAIIAMAHSLGLKVVAEGVETEVQKEMLRGRGCDEMQGYLISKPLPAEEFEQLLKERIKASALS
jgi:diguanylate cyclase (GGDEF)-like protein